MSVQRATKKPVTIEFMGPLDPYNGDDIFGWIEGNGGNVVMWDDGLSIVTLEGEMVASFGDLIIRGVAGEFYPCKPDIFAATYDVEGQA